MSPPFPLPAASKTAALFGTWPQSRDQQNPFEKVLLRSTGAALAGDTTNSFKIVTPDVKCMTKITVFIALPEGSTRRYLSENFTTEYAAGAKLWVASLTRMYSGTGQQVPTRSIVQARAAGLLIPPSADLWGYEIIEQTVGDVVYGELTVQATDGVSTNQPALNVNWCVRVDYQSTTAMTAQEWSRLTQSAGVAAAEKTLV